MLVVGTCVVPIFFIFCHLVDFSVGVIFFFYLVGWLENGVNAERKI